MSLREQDALAKRIQANVDAKFKKWKTSLKTKLADDFQLKKSNRLGTRCALICDTSTYCYIFYIQHGVPKVEIVRDMSFRVVRSIKKIRKLDISKPIMSAAELFFETHPMK